MSELVYLPVLDINPHPDNPRKELGDLSELVSSIKANGILQNLTVVPRDGGGYTAIIGHRRLAAAKEAGLEAVPCIIADMAVKEQLSTMMTENMQRSDLTIYEQAQGFQLMLDFGDSIEEIAKQSGFSATTVRKRVKLLDYDRDKFIKSQERGATLADFAELEKVESMDARNKLLDFIGTKDFRNRLAAAIEDEASAKKMNHYREQIGAWAFEIERIREYNGQPVDMKYYLAWSRWSSAADVPMPDDAADRRYFYIDYGDRLEVWVEKEVDAEEERLKEERLERQAVVDATADQLGAMAVRHYQLRHQFVKELPGEVIAENIVLVNKALMNTIASVSLRYSFNAQCFAGLVDMTAAETADFDVTNMFGTLSVDALAERDLPRLQLYIWYAAIDNERRSYWSRVWKGQEYDIDWRENPELEGIYDVLIALGYEMSTEEIEMAAGTHRLFGEVIE